MDSTNRLLGVLSHASFFFLPIILPLILMLVKNDDPFVRHHARQALIFHGSVYVAGWIFSLLSFILIGIPLLFALGIFGFVVTIIAIIRTADSQYYQYPITGNWFN